MTDLNNSISSAGGDDNDSVKALIERDFYGCYSLKFRIKHGSSVTEKQIYRDFGQFGDVLDVWGAGFVYKESTQVQAVKFSDRLDTEVIVRMEYRRDAEKALKYLREFYHELTPAISDVLPDNHGLYTISFENKMGIPTNDLFHEFSKSGEIKSITGALSTRMGRVYVSFWRKESAIQAFLNKTERWFMNMRFTFPRCEKDYCGTYCMKFYNTKGTPNYATESQVKEDFGRYGEVVDIRGPGLFDVPGDDVYVRYWEKTSAQTALSSLVGRYDCICITPASDIQPDKFGVYTLTFVNKPNISEDEAWRIFREFGPVAEISGTFGVRTGRVFVSFEDKYTAIRAMQDMLITKQFHLQLAKSCKPVRFPKSTKNYYSAATRWSTSEFPSKRKERDGEGEIEGSKKRRDDEKGGDCFLRKDERYSRESRGSGNYSFKIAVRDERLPFEKSNVEHEVEPNYSYRPPYQDSQEANENHEDDGGENTADSEGNTK